MKILVDPVYTIRDIRKCATHYMLMTTALEALKNDPTRFVYYIVPDKGWIVEGLPQDERIRYIPLPKWRDRYKEFLFLQEQWLDLFADWGAYFDWDVLLTTRNLGIPQVRTITGKSVAKKCIIVEPLPVVAYKRTVRNYFDHWGAYMHLQTAASYLLADRVYVNTQHELDGIVKSLRPFISASALRDLEGKLETSFPPPVGLDLEYPMQRPVKTEPPYLLVYTQRMDETERQPWRAFESFFRSYAMGGRVLCEVYTNSPSSGGYEQEFPFIRFAHPDRQSFRERLRQSHIFVSFSIEEGLPLGLFEAVTSGVIGIVLRAPWSEDMFGADYPWLVQNEREASTVVRWMEGHYAEAYQMFLHWYQNHFLKLVQEKGTLFATIEKQIGALEEPPPDRGGIVEMVQSWATSRERTRFKIREALDDLSAQGVTRFDFREVKRKEFRNVPLLRGTDLYGIRRKLMARYGWQDTAEPGVMEVSRGT